MMSQGIFHYGNIGRLFLLVISSLFWAGSGLSAQPAQLDFRHYTIDDGLPSSEVYTTFEDNDGFVWIGTDNGVARFDGYEFTVFDGDDGLEDVVVFTIMEDAAGTLWVSTYSGRIYYFENGRFHPYAYNEITAEFKKNSELVILLDVTDSGEIVVNVKPMKIVRITTAGEVVSLVDKTSPLKGPLLYQHKRIKRSKMEGRLHTMFNNSFSMVLSTSGESELGILGGGGSYTTKILRPAKPEKLFKLESGSIWRRPDTDKSEALIVSRFEIIIAPLNEEPVRQYPANGRIVNAIMPGLEADKYWVFLNRGHGLERHTFFPGEKHPRVSRFLDGHSVSSGAFDSDGGFWVTTLDDGIYYCPYPKQRVYLKDDVTENAKSISLALTGPENFYAGYDDGSIFKYDEGEEGLWEVLTPKVVVDERLYDIFYDSTHARVYAPNFSFKHSLIKEKQLSEEEVEYYKRGNVKNNNFSYFNYFPESHPDKLFTTNGLFFTLLSLDSEINLSDVKAKKLKFRGGHVLGVGLDGKVLLGTLHGLYEISPDYEMIPNNLGVEELSGRVVFIKHVNQTGMLFGTRGNGLIYWDRDTSYQIRETDGLASDMIRDIHKDCRGFFWVSTLNGLSKVVFSNDNHSYNLRTFRTENGLPTNEVSQVDTWGDEVWLATSTGIVHFKEPPVDSVSPPPTIRQVFVNGEEHISGKSYDLPAGNQDISIRFGTINFFLSDQLKYRYRITTAGPWQYSNERTANYPNMSAGSYQFAVQSQNQDGFWSESTYLDIYIATPWYKSWWAITCAALLLIGAVSTYFMIRERRRKREQNLLLQINELEHAALHAQMNPHFVFNALNSIQNFVLENDAKQAATYLSRFARIIRQTLRSSVDGKHSLREELDMLRTYLVLEKLRFKEGFNYELTVSPDLPVDGINLPPLLIQPFVENAIVHGLKGRKRGGWISIDFTGSPEMLRVQVEDNGRGFDPARTIKNDSLGMDITRRRLEMMNRNLVDHSGMKIEPLYDDDDRICGTRVTLNIQLEKLNTTTPAATPR